MNDLLYLPALRGATVVLPLELFTGGKKSGRSEKDGTEKWMLLILFFLPVKFNLYTFILFCGMNCFIAL